jgi:hypothetical protein
VFAIGVRHRFFTFYHAISPAVYLEVLAKKPTQLTINNFCVFKQYPASQWGLDICDPAQRTEILCLLSCLLNFITSGNAKIGVTSNSKSVMTSVTRKNV